MRKKESLYTNAFRLIKEYTNGELEGIEIIIRDTNTDWDSFDYYPVEDGLIDARIIEQIDILKDSGRYIQLKSEAYKREVENWPVV